MSPPSPTPSAIVARTAPALAIGLAWLLAMGVLAWSGMSLMRLLAAAPPATLTEPQTPPLSPANLAAALVGQNLFANQSDHPAEENQRSDTMLDAIRLVGIATGFSGGRAFVLVKRGEETLGLSEGDTLASDWEIAAIHADRIELRTGNRTTSVRMHTAHAASQLRAPGKDPQPPEED